MNRSAAGGAIVWVALITARLASLTRMTLIDLLFLLAPLVIVPLGLALIAFDGASASRLRGAAVRIQPVGAALVTLSFLPPIGVLSAILGLGWLLGARLQPAWPGGVFIVCAPIASARRAPRSRTAPPT